jgi:hypothetical protein
VLLFAIPACSYSLTLMAHDNAEMGRGTATKDFMRSGVGDLTITVGGETFRGRWSYAGAGSAGLLYGFGGTMPVMTYSGGGSGDGGAMLKSESGAGLRCRFAYSTWTGAGHGLCEDTRGRKYDMQIDMY